MPRAKVDGGAALISIPGCLICWEPLQQRKTSTTSINSEKTFRRICSILNVDLSSSTWDFRIEAFPFCATCTREIQQLIRLQDKLELIQKEIQDEIQTVRNKLVGSDHKFISADLRIIGFRSQVLGGQLQHSVFSTGSQIQPTNSSVSSSSGFHQSFPLNYHSEQLYSITGNYDSTSGYTLGLVNTTNIQGHNSSSFSQLTNPIPAAHQNYHSALYNNNRNHDQNNTGFETGAISLVELEVKYNESNSTLNEYDNSNDNGPLSAPSHDEDYNMSPAPSTSKAKGRSSSKKVFSQKNSTSRYQGTDIIGRVSQPKSARLVEDFAAVITNTEGRMFYENIEIMKNDQGTFYCGQCEYNKERANTSVTLTRMKIHINGVHLDRYKCSVCDKSYTSREHLIGHEKKQHQIGVVLTPCPICGMPITDFSNWMKVHMWRHKNAEEKAEARALGLEPAEITNSSKPRNMKHKCPHCNKGFYRIKAMERHAKGHEKPNVILKQTLITPGFKTVFENVEITKNETGFVCGKCGFNKIKGFKPLQFKQIKEHIKAHYGAYRCEICNKNCKHEAALKAHKRVHGERKKNPCEICQKPILSGKFGMRHHMWLHKNDQEKEEARALGLAPREVVKRTEKKYICKTCQRGFTFEKNMERHQILHLPLSEQFKMKCPSCDSVYRTKEGLVQHFRIKHDNKVIAFACPAPGCGMRFVDSKSRDRHANSKHKSKFDRFSCRVCSKKFIIKSHLELHSKSHPFYPKPDVKRDSRNKIIDSKRDVKRDNTKKLVDHRSIAMKMKPAKSRPNVRRRSKRPIDDSTSESEFESDHESGSDSDLEIIIRPQQEKPTTRGRRSIAFKPENQLIPDQEDFTLSLNSLPQSLLYGNSVKIISDSLVSYFNSDGEIKLLSLNQDQEEEQASDSDHEMLFEYEGQSEEVDSESEIEFKLFPDPDCVDDPLSIND